MEDELCLVALKTLAHLDEVPPGFKLTSQSDGFHAEWSGKKGKLLKASFPAELDLAVLHGTVMYSTYCTV